MTTGSPDDGGRTRSLNGAATDSTARLPARQADWVDHHAVFLRLLAVVVAQWLDLTTFIAMVDRRGAAAEANPLVARLLNDGGVALVTLGKAALVLLVVSTVVILSGDRRPNRYPVLAWIIVIAAVGAGMIGGLSNVATIVG